MSGRGSHAKDLTGARGGAPERVGVILGRVIATEAFKPLRSVGKRPGELQRLWQEAVGPELASETYAAGVRRGVLVVEARSSALLAELTSFRKQELLSKFLAVDPSGRVTALQFRMGAF